MHQPTLEMSLAKLGFSTLVGLDQLILKKAYHRLAQKHHPDKGGEEKEFILLRECYIFLRDYLDNPNRFDEQETPLERDFEKEIQILKEYITKLQKRIAEYETMIDSQISSINEARPQLDQIANHYEHSFDNLNQWYQDKQALLKKNYENGFVDILLARKKLSDQEYISLNNQLVENYNKQAIEIEREYSKKVINIYKTSINKIMKGYL
jgi:septal ring factor EnvC (AmiA/AmiB activator)